MTTLRDENIKWVTSALSALPDDEIIRWARFTVAIAGPAIGVLTGCDQRSISSRAAAIQLFAGYREAAQHTTKSLAVVSRTRPPFHVSEED